MYVCIICGYNKMEYPQWNKEGYPTYTICDCCGFESGYDDDNLGMTIEEYRESWIKDGANWFSSYIQKPNNWNAKKQLKNIDIDIY